MLLPDDPLSSAVLTITSIELAEATITQHSNEAENERIQNMIKNANSNASHILYFESTIRPLFELERFGNLRQIHTARKHVVISTLTRFSNECAA